MFCFFLRVCRSTGGKSPLRLVNPHLQRRLERFTPKLRHRLQHLDFAAVDPLSVRGLIDRLGHPTHRLLEFDLHPLNELLDRKMNLPIHGHAPCGHSLAATRTTPKTEGIVPLFGTPPPKLATPGANIMAFRNTYGFAGALRSLAWLLLLAWSAKAASASFIPIFESAGNGTYSYQLNFATNGSEWLARGDFVTLYDIGVPGTIAEVSIPGEPDFLTASVQLLGQTPAGLVGAEGLVDDPALLNLTVAYVGTPISGPGAIQNINVTIPGTMNLTRLGIFTSTDTLDVGGPLYQLGAVPVPALVPEPGTMGLAGVLVGIVGRHYRARRWMS
ncbi:PEP-CTERM sorting domain-containing protein [Fontivita pretiosa]|uniref:PEP-CTERM sorting domain-containing protein n=1 Tax=Fontivita pretiosa TaxID=2989684 RepID=UPI003D177E55